MRVILLSDEQYDWLHKTLQAEVKASVKIEEDLEAESFYDLGFKSVKEYEEELELTKEYKHIVASMLVTVGKTNFTGDN